MKKKSCIVLILIISVLSGCSSNTGGKETINQLKTTASGTVIEEVTTGGAITKSNNKGELFPRDYCEETDIEINGRQYKYIKYCLEQDDTVRIISLKTTEDELYIPAELYGRKVSIVGGDWEELPNIPDYFEMTAGKYAWQNRKRQKLKKIEVGEGIKEIYSESFRAVSAKKIVLPKSLEVIGDVAFADTKTEKVIIKSDNVRLKMADKQRTEIEKNSCFRGNRKNYTHGFQKYRSGMH